MSSRNHHGGEASLSAGTVGEEPLDAEDTEDCSRRAAEGGCAAPAPSCSERFGGTAARDAILPESRSPQPLQDSAESSDRLGARPPSAALCGPLPPSAALCGPLRA